MSLLVSIIMPAYNAEKFLGEAIKSVLDQTFKKWELIIVDDGSMDNTGIIAQSFCNADKRIKYFYQENGRQGKARNLALFHCCGKYIAFLDADDLWLPEKLELQLKQLEEKDVDLVFSDCKVFSNTLSESAPKLNITPGIFSGNTALKFFLQQNKIPILSVLMKADALRSIGGFTEKPSIQNAEDYHLWLRLILSGSTFFGSRLVLAAYRDHTQASTNTDKLAMPNVIEALSDIINTYPQQKFVIKPFVKKWFREYHYYLKNPDIAAYRVLIEKNCRYTDSSFYNRFFQLALTLFGFRITRKLINKIINGSNQYHYSML